MQVQFHNQVSMSLSYFLAKASGMETGSGKAVL